MNALSIPEAAPAHITAARLLADRFWPPARLHYLTALTLAQSEPRTMQAYGDALHRRGAYSLAREVWEQLTNTAPDDMTAYLKLANAYQELGDDAALLRTLHRLIARFPMQAQHHRRLAETYLQLGQTTAAEATWKRVTELFPHSPEGYAGLARTYDHQRDNTRAIAIMLKVVDMAPGTLRSHRYLAHLYQKIGATDMARREYRRLEVFHPDNPDVLYQLGEYFRTTGDAHRAREYYHRAVQLKPAHAGFRRALAKLEVEMSKKP